MTVPRGTPPGVEQSAALQEDQLRRIAALERASTSGSGGSVVIPDPLLLADGSAAAPSLAFTADTNTGLYRDGTDSISVATGGVQRLDIDGGGIKGKVPFAAPSGSAGSPSFGFDGDADTGMYRRSTNEIGFATGGTESLRLTGNNLRMGSGTSLIYNVGYFRGVDATGTAASPTYSWNADSDTGMYHAATNTIGWSVAGVRKMQLSSDRLYLWGGTNVTSYIGPINANYFYLSTGSNAFYFNKGLRVDTGVVSSHNEDLFLARAGTVKMRMYSTQTVSLQRFKIDGPNIGTGNMSWGNSQLLIESLNSSGSESTNSLVQLALHNDRYNVAPIIRNFGVDGEKIGFTNNGGTAYVAILAAAFTVSSTIRGKQDIEAVSDADAIALAEQFLLTSFLPNARPQNTTPCEGSDDWESHDHDCTMDPCDGSADSPCPVCVNDTRRFGGLAEWWGDVVPEQVHFDGEGIADSIDMDQVATTALGATGALSRRLTEALETIVTLESRLTALEGPQ